MGLLRRKGQGIDLGPSTLLPAGDPGCWLVRATATTGSAPAVMHLPADLAPEVPAAATVAAFEADPEPVLAPVVPVEEPARAAVPSARPARARLAALTANLSV